LRKVANDVMAQLRERNPDKEFEFEGDKIKGPDRVVYLSNLYREVKRSPSRREKLIKEFVATLGQPANAEIGHETWEDARGRIVPVLKPRNYIGTEGPTQHLLTTEWLADVL